MSEVALDTRGDLARAKGLIVEIAGHCWRGKGDMLDRVYDAVCRYNRDTLRRGASTITRRRLRAWFHQEAAGVRFHEMVELAQVAKAARGMRLTHEEARKGHDEFVTQAARMAVALAVQDEEFHREAIELFSELARQTNDQQVGQAAAQGHEGHGRRNPSFPPMARA